MKSESSANSEAACLPLSGPRHCGSAAHGDHQRRARREGAAQRRLLWGSVQSEGNFGIVIFIPPKKGNDVSSWQTGKFWEK